MARHRINEDGHMIWFDDDDEYNADLEEKAELRRKQEEAAAEEAAEEEKVDTILKVGCFVIVLIFLGILGLCSSSNKKNPICF